MRLLPLIMILSFLLCACGNDPRIRRVLDDADRIVMTMPDSAAAMLGSLDMDGAPASERARHALLLTKALRKAHVMVTDDSLIRIAAGYYRGRGDSLEVQSLFYNGAVLRYGKDYPDALILLMEACDRAAETGNDFYRAMACREQASIYTTLCNYDRAAELGREAVEAFYKAGRPLHAAWERVYIPQSLVYSGRTDEAYDSIRVLASDSLILADTVLLKEFLWIASNVCFERGDYDLAEEYFDSLVSVGGVPSSKLLSQMAKLKLVKNDTVEARQYWKLATELQKDESDSLAALWALTEIYKSEGDYKNAYLLYESMADGEASLTNELITHPYTALLNNYFRAETIRKSMQLEESYRQMGAWISVCIVLLIFMAVSVYIYRNRLQQKELEREIMMRDLDALKSRISEIQATDLHDSRDRQDDDIYLLEILKSICEWQCLYSLRNGKFGDFTVKVSELLTDDDNFHLLEQYIDRNHDNLMARFRHQAGTLNERQFRIAGFLFLGFSDTTIASLFHISAPAVRQLRYRIRKKLKENPNPDMDIFLGYF